MLEFEFLYSSCLINYCLLRARIGASDVQIWTKGTKYVMWLCPIAIAYYVIIPIWIPGVITLKFASLASQNLNLSTLVPTFITSPPYLTTMYTKPLAPKTITDNDEYLKPDVPAIIQRHNSFRNWKDTFDKHEGGFDKFTKGYLKFGLNVGSKNQVTYREWAPNAKEAYLVGEFSESCMTIEL